MNGHMKHDIDMTGGGRRIEAHYCVDAALVVGGRGIRKHGAPKQGYGRASATFTHAFLIGRTKA